jgi:hypothetical protein
LSRIWPPSLNNATIYAGAIAIIAIVAIQRCRDNPAYAVVRGVNELFDNYWKDKDKPDKVKDLEEKIDCLLKPYYW